MGVTSLRASHALTNNKGSRVCAVDGWIANRYEYLGSLFSQMSGLDLRVSRRVQKIDILCRSRVLLDYDFSAVPF